MSATWPIEASQSQARIPSKEGIFFCQECQKISLTHPPNFEKMPNLFSESGGGGDENHSALNL
jgi:hypothetical protein